MGGRGACDVRVSFLSRFNFREGIPRVCSSMKALPRFCVLAELVEILQSTAEFPIYSKLYRLGAFFTAPVCCAFCVVTSRGSAAGNASQVSAADKKSNRRCLDDFLEWRRSFSGPRTYLLSLLNLHDLQRPRACTTKHLANRFRQRSIYPRHEGGAAYFSQEETARRR